MSSEWQVLNLEDCLDALIDYRGKTPKKTNSGIPLVTAKVIKGGRIETPTEYIALEDYDEWMRRGIPKAGDVVMTTEAPLGEVAQLGDEKIALAQRVITLRGKSGLLDSTYLLYLLQTEEMQEKIKARSTGTTVLGIKQSELRKIPVSIPPLQLQQKVSAVLSVLDRRIALLRESNVTLESIAHTFFKSWFVDFDPVLAKQEGRVPDGIDAETAALFPDSFEESEFGLIPKGWSFSALSESYELNPTRVLKKGVVAPYLDMANVQTKGHSPDRIVPREAGSGARFLNGDTLLARITPCLQNGKASFVDFLNENEVGWGSTEFIVLRPKSPLPNYHAYLLCRFEKFREFAISSMTGTSGRQRVQVDMLGRFKIALPTENICDVFNDIVAPIQQKIAQNAEQIKTLSCIRDVLLPRLISGQLRIPDLE